MVGAPLLADYNVAPTKEVYAVVQQPARPEPERDLPAERQLRVLTWGLIPSWAKDPSIASRLINARLETAADKPAFRKAFASRRCLLPADGYYEWYPAAQVGARGKPVKQPFFIRPREGGVLAMAGLYEIWRDPTRADEDPARFRWTCTVLTTRAEDDLGHIHDRMPLMVEPRRWGQWLDPHRDAPADLLTPAQASGLEAYPVSRRVNDVRNNGPDLLTPLPLSPQGTAPTLGEPDG